jgi:hypothetical protein
MIVMVSADEVAEVELELRSQLVRRLAVAARAMKTILE